MNRTPANQKKANGNSFSRQYHLKDLALLKRGSATISYKFKPHNSQWSFISKIFSVASPGKRPIKSGTNKSSSNKSSKAQRRNISRNGLDNSNGRFIGKDQSSSKGHATEVNGNDKHFSTSCSFRERYGHKLNKSILSYEVNKAEFFIKQQKLRMLNQCDSSSKLLSTQATFDNSCHGILSVNNKEQKPRNEAQDILLSFTQNNKCEGTIQINTKALQNTSTRRGEKIMNDKMLNYKLSKFLNKRTKKLNDNSNKETHQPIRKSFSPLNKRRSLLEIDYPFEVKNKRVSKVVKEDNESSPSPNKKLLGFLFQNSQNRTLPNKPRLSRSLTQSRFSFDITSYTPIKRTEPNDNANALPFRRHYEIIHNDSIHFSNEKEKGNAETEQSNVLRSRKTMTDLDLSFSNSLFTLALPLIPQPTSELGLDIKESLLAETSESILLSIDEGKSIRDINQGPNPKFISSVKDNENVLSTAKFPLITRRLSLHDLLKLMKNNALKEYNLIVLLDYNKKKTRHNAIKQLIHHNDQNMAYARTMLLLEEKVSAFCNNLTQLLFRSITLQDLLLNELVRLSIEKEVVDNINLVTDLIRKDLSLLNELLYEQGD